MGFILSVRKSYPLEMLLPAVLHAVCNPRNMTVVVAHHNEDVEWLSRINLPKHLCSKSAGLPGLDLSCSHEENIGDQHIHFVKWILAYYDTLPDYVAFIDAHERDWHGDFDLPAYLQCLLSDEAVPLRDVYHPLTSLSHTRKLGFHMNWDKHWEEITTAREASMKELWAITSEHTGAPYPTRVSHHCCAQFLVSRDRILQRPRESWLELYKFLCKAPPITTHSDLSFAMEYSWHMLLGESPQSEEQSPLGSPKCLQRRGEDPQESLTQEPDTGV
jgi:hypothetical protein